MTKKSAPHLKLSVGEKGFYTAIAKLEKRGDLIKAGSLLFSREAMDKAKQRGELIPEEAVSRIGASGVAVLEALGDQPEGLSASDLKEIVSARPDAAKSMKKHSNYIYNVLSHLIESGRVVKVDKLYRLGPKS